MHESHADGQRDQSGKSQPVLLEQHLGANKPASDPEQDDNSCKQSTPPADKQRRLILLKGASSGGGGVERHDRRPTLEARAWRQQVERAPQNGAERVLPGSIEGIPVFVGMKTAATVLRPGLWHGLVSRATFRELEGGSSGCEAKGGEARPTVLVWPR